MKPLILPHQDDERKILGSGSSATFFEYHDFMKIVAFDGRLVAKACPVRMRGWMVIGYGLGWIHPNARKFVSVDGDIDPTQVWVSTKSEAREMLLGIL